MHKVFRKRLLSAVCSGILGWAMLSVVSCTVASDASQSPEVPVFYGTRYQGAGFYIANAIEPVDETVAEIRIPVKEGGQSLGLVVANGFKKDVLLRIPHQKSYTLENLFFVYDDGSRRAVQSRWMRLIVASAPLHDSFIPAPSTVDGLIEVSADVAMVYEIPLYFHFGETIINDPQVGSKDTYHLHGAVGEFQVPDGVTGVECDVVLFVEFSWGDRDVDWQTRDVRLKVFCELLR